MVCILIVETIHAIPFNPTWAMHLDDPHLSTEEEYNEVMRMQIPIPSATSNESLSLLEMINRHSHRARYTFTTSSCSTTRQRAQPVRCLRLSARKLSVQARDSPWQNQFVKNGQMETDQLLLSRGMGSCLHIGDNLSDAQTRSLRLRLEPIHIAGSWQTNVDRAHLLIPVKRCIRNDSEGLPRQTRQSILFHDHVLNMIKSFGPVCRHIPVIPLPFGNVSYEPEHPYAHEDETKDAIHFVRPSSTMPPEHVQHWPRLSPPCSPTLGRQELPHALDTTGTSTPYHPKAYLESPPSAISDRTNGLGPRTITTMTTVATIKDEGAYTFSHSAMGSDK